VSRLATIEEVIGLGDHLGWADLVVEARNWRAATLTQLGRHDDARPDTARLHEWARQSGRPFFVALSAMRRVDALLQEGRFDEAEAALSNPPPGAHASPNFSEAAAAQLFLLRLAQGRSGELLAMIETFLDDGQAPYAWRAAYVVALAAAGDERATPALHAHVAALSSAPRNWLWLSAVALLADACIALRDERMAPVLERALRNHESEIVAVAHGIASLGPVAPRLEALRAVSRDHKEAASVA
jgi:hypothetical protein